MFICYLCEMITKEVYGKGINLMSNLSLVVSSSSSPVSDDQKAERSICFHCVFEPLKLGWGRSKTQAKKSNEDKSSWGHGFVHESRSLWGEGKVEGENWVYKLMWAWRESKPYIEVMSFDKQLIIINQLT